MGLSVKNVSSGETIIDFQGNKYFTPASNVKLFTLYAALTTLKDSVPSFEYCKSGDSLIIRGTGDPTFLNDSLHANSIKFLKNKKVKLYFLDKDLDDLRAVRKWLDMFCEQCGTKQKSVFITDKENKSVAADVIVKIKALSEMMGL